MKQRNSSLAQPTLVFFISCVASFVIFYLLQILMVKTELIVKIEASVSKGTNMEVFTANRNATLPLQTAKRSVYTFSLGSEPLTEIRYDFTDTQGAEVKIYKIEIWRGSHLVSELDRNYDLKCCSSGLKEVANNPKEAISFLSTNNDPMLILSKETINKLNSREGNWLSALTAALRVFSHPLALLTVLLIVSLLQSKKPQLKFYTITAIMLFLTSHICRIFDNISYPFGNAKLSISRSVFSGIPKTKELVQFYGTSLFIFFLAFFVFRKIRIPEFNEHSQDSKYEINRWTKVIWLLLLTLISVSIFPNIIDNLIIGANSVQTSQWDGQNIITWEYALSKGMLPIKDYFYPYGGQFYFGSHWPSHQFLLGIHRFLLVFALGISLASIFKWRLMIPILYCIFVVASIQAGLASSLDRYLTPFAGLLCLIALEDQKFRFKQIVAALIMLWITLIEPNQTVLIILSFFGALVLTQFRTLREVLGRRTLAFALGLSALAALLIIFGVALYPSGLTTAVIDSYRTLGGIVEIAKIPGNVQSWFKYFTNLDGYLVLICISGIILSAYYVCQNLIWKRSNVYSFAMVGVTILLFGEMFKQVIRPHISQQLFACSLLICLFWIHFLIPKTKSASAMIMGLAFPLCLVQTTSWPNWESLIYSLKTAPTNMATIFHQEDFRNLWLESFNPSRFRSWWGSGPELVDFFEKVYPAHPRLFNFGTQPYFYPILDQKPYYSITQWELTPIGSQNALLEQFKVDPPEIIIWDPQTIAMDGIPAEVRNPLIVDYVVSHFVFDRSFNGLLFLKKLPNLAKVDLEFWLKSLGDTISLGHIPNVISPRDYPSCTSSTCGKLLKIERIGEDQKDEVVTFKIKSGQHVYNVNFDFPKATRSVSLPLHRLWFWNAVAFNGKNPEIEIPPSYSFEISNVEKRTDLLY
jgi:hypothetical protein